MVRWAGIQLWCHIYSASKRLLHASGQRACLGTLNRCHVQGMCAEPDAMQRLCAAWARMSGTPLHTCAGRLRAHMKAMLWRLRCTAWRPLCWQWPATIVRQALLSALRHFL